MSDEANDLQSPSKNTHESICNNKPVRCPVENRNSQVQTRENVSSDNANRDNSKKRRSVAINGSNGMHNTRMKSTLDTLGYRHKGYGIQHSASSSHVLAGTTNLTPNSNNNRNQLEFPQDNRTINYFTGKSKHFANHRNSFVNATNAYPSVIINTGHQLNHDTPSTRTSTGGKVKFSPDVNKTYSKMKQMNVLTQNKPQNNIQQIQYNGLFLQRSKSLSSADNLIYSFAALDLSLGVDETDIGKLSPEIKSLIKTALVNPNNLNSRCLMELPSHCIKQAVEGRRFALPIARICFTIIAKEQKETFLESLLNTCRQWYQEREKLLSAIQGMKNPSRLRLISFMAFLTEMFCKLKRRQMQLRKQYEGSSPPLVLLNIVAKCCEEIVKPPIKSLTEIECLFYVLTYTGSDLELHLPQELEKILSMIRDGFLNANDSPPAIKRTLLQLIELQASHWQLPGNTVLYYYPSGK